MSVADAYAPLFGIVLSLLEAVGGNIYLGIERHRHIDLVPLVLRILSDLYPSAAERREAARERGPPPPSMSSPKPSSEPAFSADQLYYDASAAQSRREDALRERGLLPPVPLERVPSRSSTPVSQTSSNQSHEKCGKDRDATTLEETNQMEQSLGTRLTAAERIKAEWEARQLQEESSSDVLCVLRGPPQRDVERPNAPSADEFALPVAVSARRPTTKDLPLLDANNPARRLSSSTSLSGETLHTRRPKVYTRKMMEAELEKIEDEESRMLTRLAFMM
ncbi:hypothetical protein BDZ89DRAFT_1042357 [Hymenopellis radicata]|nr:hypothetical protein BDZ89DRAFT_1042357 [Hymenopellis radicata]